MAGLEALLHSKLTLVKLYRRLRMESIAIPFLLFVGALAGVGYGRRTGVRRFRVTPVPRDAGNADA